MAGERLGPPLPTQEDVLQIDPSGNLAGEVIKSAPFEKRFRAGVNSLLYGIDSGFSVLHQGGELVYTMQTSNLKSPSQKPEMSKDWIDRHGEEGLDGYEVIGTFRFINRETPFTNSDMVDFRIEDRRETFPCAPGRMEGVIMPLRGDVPGAQGIRVFMFRRKEAVETNIPYDRKFDFLSPEEQKRRLEDHGMLVMMFDLPIQDREIDFGPLEEVLQGHSVEPVDDNATTRWDRSFGGLVFGSEEMEETYGYHYQNEEPVPQEGTVHHPVYGDISRQEARVYDKWVAFHTRRHTETSGTSGMEARIESSREVDISRDSPQGTIIEHGNEETPVAASEVVADSRQALDAMKEKARTFKPYNGMATNIPKGTRTAWLGNRRVDLLPTDDYVRMRFHTDQAGITSFIQGIRSGVKVENLKEGLSRDGSDLLDMYAAIDDQGLYVTAGSAHWDGTRHIDSGTLQTISPEVFNGILGTLSKDHQGERDYSDYSGRSLNLRVQNGDKDDNRHRRQGGHNSYMSGLEFLAVSPTEVENNKGRKLWEKDLKPEPVVKVQTNRPKSKFERKARQAAARRAEKGKGKKEKK